MSHDGHTPAQEQSSRLEVHEGGLTFWLDGEVLGCACPDCGSPMSIRLWLAVADCWRCGASVELTEEQQRAAQRLIQQAQQSVHSTPAVQKPIAKRPPGPRAPSRPKAVIPTGRPARKPPVRSSVLDRVQDDWSWLRDVLGHLQAWLISALLHMILLILLACLLLGPEPPQPRLLILATRASLQDRPGTHGDPPEPDPVEFDDAGAPQLKLPPNPQPPEQDPSPLEKEPLPQGEPPSQEQRTPQVGSPVAGSSGRSLLQGRRPDVRARILEQEGGTIETEMAVARGLEWLVRHQHPGGNWSLDRFSRARSCRGRCSHLGRVRSDVAATALALLPFLGAGNTHRQGKYRHVVRRGLRWLVRRQEPDGSLTDRPFRTGMYAHGLATIALCEAYAMTGDSQLRLPAQKAVDFIVRAQHPQGGWRYFPGMAGDTSVTGWQLMALRSAEMAGLEVSHAALQRASRFLDRCQVDLAGGLYGYMAGDSTPRVALTAESLLMRMYAGWTPQHPALQFGCQWLLDHHPPQTVDIYYWYYAAQLMHHMGEPFWSQWNLGMREVLVRTQEQRGHQAGSWTPRVAHDPVGGRLYMTALAICCLEVYYRHLPLYRPVAITEP